MSAFLSFGIIKRWLVSWSNEPWVWCWQLVPT